MARLLHVPKLSSIFLGEASFFIVFAMAGKLVATAVVDVDNMISDTDDSGSYIEVEVDSDGNEIISGITISNPHNNMKATVKTTSASVGGMIWKKNRFQI